MRKIPRKNYLIFLIMVVCVVGIVFYLADLYTSKTKNKYISPMNIFATEVMVDDIENYVMENSIVVLYVSDKKDETLKEREESFKNLLIKYNIQRYFVYLDMSTNANDVSKRFEERYKEKINYDNLPFLIVMLDGKIVGTYVEDEYDKDKIITFLIDNEVIEVD